MFEIDFSKPPYGVDAKQKNSHFLKEIKELTEYHRCRCPEYGRMLAAAGYDEGCVENATLVEDMPFLPVGLFKDLRLSSLDESQDDYKTVTSSGTSSQAKAQIILDGETRSLQQQALISIVGDYLGKSRLPMLVIDCPATVQKLDHFSARTTGILGFSLFGRKRVFALKDDMTLNLEELDAFLEKNENQPFFMYGFTAIYWQYFLQALGKECKKRDFSQGIFIHGGGWKKMTAMAVSKAEFKRQSEAILGLRKIHEYYGMAEQTGSIFMACECGHLHVSQYSEVRIRRGKDLSLCEVGESGIIQVLSNLPRSYPGHSLLTEDEGRLLGIDDCPCGRKGAYFEVFGRLKHAQMRGCSDTFEPDKSEPEHLATEKSEMSEHLVFDKQAQISWVLGDAQILTEIKQQATLPIFDERTLDFLEQLSVEIRRHPETIQYPDLAAFGFWCRRRSLRMQKEQQEGMGAGKCEDESLANRVGRGMSFHINLHSAGKPRHK